MPFTLTLPPKAHRSPRRAAAPLALALVVALAVGPARAHHHDQHADEAANRHAGDREAAATAKPVSAASEPQLEELPANDPSALQSDFAAAAAAAPSLHADPKIANDFNATNDMKAFVKDMASGATPDPAALRAKAGATAPAGPDLAGPAPHAGNPLSANPSSPNAIGADPIGGDPLVATPGPPSQELQFDLAPPRADGGLARPPRPAIPAAGLFAGLLALAVIGLGSGFVLSRRLRSGANAAPPADPNPPPGP